MRRRRGIAAPTRDRGLGKARVALSLLGLIERVADEVHEPNPGVDGELVVARGLGGEGGVEHTGMGRAGAVTRPSFFAAIDSPNVAPSNGRTLPSDSYRVTQNAN